MCVCICVGVAPCTHCYLTSHHNASTLLLNVSASVISVESVKFLHTPVAAAEGGILCRQSRRGGGGGGRGEGRGGGGGEEEEQEEEGGGGGGDWGGGGSRGWREKDDAEEGAK